MTSPGRAIAADKMVIGVTLLILAALLVMVSTTVTQEPAALSDDDADGGSGWLLLFAGMGAGTGCGALFLAVGDSVRSTRCLGTASCQPGRRLAVSSRARAIVMAVVGVTLLMLAVWIIAVEFRVTQEATTLPGDDTDGGGGGWILFFAGVGAGTGFGALVLGIADFVRNSLRYRRERRRLIDDWRDDRGYR